MQAESKALYAASSHVVNVNHFKRSHELLLKALLQNQAEL